MNSTSSGIILAGGQSRRMGRDKALLVRPAMMPEGPGSIQETFSSYLVKLLGKYCAEVLLVARSHEQFKAAQFGAEPGPKLVIDELPDHGPLMGLYSGLRATNASHALVVAVDMPFVKAELLSFLLAQPLDETLLVPVVAGIPQVLLARYPRSLLPCIEEQLQTGRRALRSLLEIAPVQYVDEAQLRTIDPQLRSFVNLNTPDDLLHLS